MLSLKCYSFHHKTPRSEGFTVESHPMSLRQQSYLLNGADLGEEVKISESSLAGPSACMRTVQKDEKGQMVKSFSG